MCLTHVCYILGGGNAVEQGGSLYSVGLVTHTEHAQDINNAGWAHCDSVKEQLTPSLLPDAQVWFAVPALIKL